MRMSLKNKLDTPFLQTPLTPANWAFTIWAFIFLLQLSGVIAAQFNDTDIDNIKHRSIHAIAKPWILSWIAAIFWTFSFAHATPTSMWLACFFIFISLGATVKGLLTLYKQHTIYGPVQQQLSTYVLYSLPTSILSAWLSVASSVQFVIALSSQVHSIPSLEIISCIIAILLVLGGLAALHLHKDTAYGLTLLWALVAVFEKTPSKIVQRTTLIGLLAVLIGCIASVLRRDQSMTSSVASPSPVAWESRQPLVNGARGSVDDADMA